MGEYNLKVFAEGQSVADLEGFQRLLREKTFVGVDFGTSTTTVTRLVFNEANQKIDSAPMQIAQQQLDGSWMRDHLVPTVIAKTARGLLFGSGAKACLADPTRYAEEINVWSCFKMHLGEQYCYPRSVLAKGRDRIVLETPKDATELFFGNLDQQIRETVARENLPSDVCYAVTVPASFATNQRQELCEAVNAAGIELDGRALLDEPNSAFMGTIAYYSEQGLAAKMFSRAGSIKVVVFDYGAGTCDVSLLDVSQDLKMGNLALSRFTALGGRDIDMKIARDYLFPRLESTCAEEPTQDVKANVVYALRTPAEALKIAICRNYSRSSVGMVFADARRENRDFTVGSFCVRTRNFGDFNDRAPKLSSLEFANLMRAFSEEPETAFENGNKTFLDPIEDVLRKGRVNKDDIDFVILVGGSSKNPFVKDVIRNYFGRFVEVLDPGDIQTLVARGAAIQSFAVNGLDGSFVKPITSEDITIGTSNGVPRCVFPAGTIVPTGMVDIPGLYIRDGVERDGFFGIPFMSTAVGEKPIGVALFSVEDIPAGTPVTLKCALSANKVLSYAIEVRGHRFDGSFQMPVTNSDATPEEMRMIRAENELRRGQLANGGVRRVADIKEAAKACMAAKKYDAAADYYRSLMYENRNEHCEAELAKAYRESGDSEGELKWIRRAYERDNSFINAWYLIWALQRNEGWRSAELKKLLQEAMRRWPRDTDFKYVEMKRLGGVGERSAARALAEEMCNEWESEGVETIDRYSLDRFENVARFLDRNQLLQRIHNQQNRLRAHSGEPVDADGYLRVDSVDNSELPTRRH